MELPFPEKPKSREKASVGRQIEIKFNFRHDMMEVPSKLSSEDVKQSPRFKSGAPRKSQSWRCKFRSLHCMSGRQGQEPG